MGIGRMSPFAAALYGDAVRAAIEAEEEHVRIIALTQRSGPSLPFGLLALYSLLAGDDYILVTANEDQAERVFEAARDDVLRAGSFVALDADGRVKAPEELPLYMRIGYEHAMMQPCTECEHGHPVSEPCFGPERDNKGRLLWLLKDGTRASGLR
jgi:hypothetical protein